MTHAHQPEPTPDSTEGTLAVSTIGDLIAALPHLHGHYMVDSIVLLAFDDGQLVATYCQRLVDEPDDMRLAAIVARAAAREAGRQAVVVVIGADWSPTAMAPRPNLTPYIRVAMAALDVQVGIYAVPSVAQGAQWIDLVNPRDTGLLPDPTNSEFAIAARAAGRVAYPNLDAWAATLDPTEWEVLARREAMLDARARASAKAAASAEAYRSALIESFETVERHVMAVPDRIEPLSDDDVVDLGLALVHIEVREACLTFALGEHAAAAERLWTELVTELPAPERAEPASLLAASAYLRGEGVLASLAVRRSEDALPGHRLTGVVKLALQEMGPAEEVREFVEHLVSRSTLLAVRDSNLS